MKKSLGYLYLFCTCLFLMSCDDELPVEPATPDPEPEAEMYFPPVDNDTWETVDPTDLGWDINALQEAIQYAASKNSYNLMILHKGRIVTENYWRGNDRNSAHLIASSSKAIAAFLIGILQDKYGLDINEPISTYIGEGWSKAAPEKEALITTRHIMTMTTGLDDDLNYVGDAGTDWYYNTYSYDVLFRLAPALAGNTFEEFANQHLFSKIGMTQAEWVGTNLKCTARDMARFGILVLADRKWKDETLLEDEAYFSDMLNTSQSFNESYGYLWWLNGKPTYRPDSITFQGPLYNAMPQDAQLALGKYDQRIEVIPSLDLVVIRQGADPGLPEFGDHSFDNQLWTRLNQAIRPSGQD